MLLIGVVLVVLLFGTFLAVQLSQRQQDIRDRASVSGGPVSVTTSASSPILPGEATSITLSVNTSSALIDGVQLAFHLEGAGTAPTIESLSGSGLQSFGTVTPSGTGYDITLIGLAPLSIPVNPFSSSTNVDFVKLNFTASDTPGQITVNYDQDGSFSNIANTTPVEDGLNTVSNQSFTITDPATLTMAPTATMCAVPTQPLCQSNERVECTNQTGTAICAQCDCVPNDQPTQTPTSTPVDAPTATPTQIVQVPTNTPLPGVPTATPVAPTNTPVVNNPTNTPQPTATPDNSGVGGTTNKTCGQSCTSHSECSVNLLCYSGVCRLANNPTDTACNNPPDNGIHRTCNEYCADSRECQSGLTCYYNSCRNPRNVNDKYCAEPIVYKNNTITKTIIVTATPEPVTPTAEPVVNTLPEIFPTSEPVIAATNTPWPTYAPVAQISPEPESEEFSMVERVQGWLKGLLIVAAVISVVFFLLWLLPLLFRKRDDEQPPLQR